MSNDKIIDFAGRRRGEHRADAAGTLQQALACARENNVMAVAVAMIDADREEFYLVSEGAAEPALLGALDIVRDVILDELRRDEDE